MRKLLLIIISAASMGANADNIIRDVTCYVNRPCSDSTENKTFSWNRVQTTDKNYIILLGPNDTQTIENVYTTTMSTLTYKADSSGWAVGSKYPIDGSSPARNAGQITKIHQTVSFRTDGHPAPAPDAIFVKSTLAGHSDTFQYNVTYKPAPELSVKVTPATVYLGHASAGAIAKTEAGKPINDLVTGAVTVTTTGAGATTYTLTFSSDGGLDDGCAGDDSGALEYCVADKAGKAISLKGGEITGTTSEQNGQDAQGLTVSAIRGKGDPTPGVSHGLITITATAN